MKKIDVSMASTEHPFNVVSNPPRMEGETGSSLPRDVVQRTIRDVRSSLLASDESDDYLRGVLDASNTAIEAFNE